MATLTFTTPVQVGDISNAIAVDKLDLVSVSVNFRGATPIVSVVLEHATSKWTHTVTLTGAEGGVQWTAIKAAFPNFEKTILTLLAGKLPPGIIS